MLCDTFQQNSVAHTKCHTNVFNFMMNRTQAHILSDLKLS